MYRIVQESLTNVVRHSDAMRVRITVDVEDDTLSRSGRRRRSPTGRRGGSDVAAGFGLAGMAERVHALGGAFRAGGDDDGFTVEAMMPVRPTVRS